MRYYDDPDQVAAHRWFAEQLSLDEAAATTGREGAALLAMRETLNRYHTLAEYAARPYDKQEHAEHRRHFLRGLDIVLGTWAHHLYADRPGYPEWWRR